MGAAVAKVFGSTSSANVFNLRGCDKIHGPQSMETRSAASAPITELLRLSREGDSQAREQVFQAVFAHLRRIAAARLRMERGNQELEPTELVNEAYLDLFGRSGREFADRTHFLAVAARAMHCILVDLARRRKAAKRSWGCQVTLSDLIPSGREKWPDRVLLFNDLMQRLAKFDARAAQIVELKLFVGCTFDEVAKIVGKCPRTAKRDYKAAKAWLQAELNISDGSPKSAAGGE